MREKGAPTSSGAIILSRNGKQCLLVKQKDGGLWSLPKGSCNESESLDSCMAREVIEETGLDLTKCRYFVTRRQRWKRYLIYTVHLLEAADSLNLLVHDHNEIDLVQWMPLSLIDKLQLNKVTEECLRPYFGGNERHFYKHHWSFTKPKFWKR